MRWLVSLVLGTLIYGTAYLVGAPREDEAPRQSAGAWSKESSVHYSGCKEVRALGKAPLYAGEPGYSEDMDGDGDGIACEPHR
jgi:Excalibur calcium-binding domain